MEVLASPVSLKWVPELLRGKVGMYQCRKPRCRESLCLQQGAGWAGSTARGVCGEQSALTGQGHQMGTERSSAVAARTRQFKF